MLSLAVKHLGCAIFRQSITCLSHCMPIFDPRLVHVGLAVEKVALR